MKTPRSDLTTQEQTHVRSAIRFLHTRLGGWKTLSEVLGFEESTLRGVAQGRTVSASMAFRAARFGNVAIEDLLAGKFPSPGSCPYCGHCAQTETADLVVGIDRDEAVAFPGH